MLTSSEISKQIKYGNLAISELKENALDKPNSCMVSIGDTLYTFDDSIVIDTIGMDNYSINHMYKLNRIKIPKEGLILEPNKLYLAKTNENIKTNGYVPVLNGRASLSLLGLSIELTSGYLEDNYNDNILLSLTCTQPIKIYPNIDIGNLAFFKSLDNKNENIGMLSGKEIIKQLEIGNISITPQENIVINPNSVNLTLYKEIGYYSEKVLDLKKNNQIETLKIGESGIVLYPNKVWLGRTNEWTETKNLVPMISGRSSLGRVGMHVHCSSPMGSIGYKGYWHLGIRLVSPLKIYENLQCCQIYYFNPIGDITNTYNGTMQNLDNETIKHQLYKKMNPYKR